MKSISIRVGDLEFDLTTKQTRCEFLQQRNLSNPIGRNPSLLSSSQSTTEFVDCVVDDSSGQAIIHTLP